MFRPVEIVWNATMTHHGRKNVLYRWRQWRLRSFSAFGSGQAAVYRLSGGRKFVAHPGDHLSEGIAAQKSYEPLESRVVVKILAPGDVVIDIGANIGYYTALCAACVGEKGRVYSFEPGQATFVKLRTTIELLGLTNVEANELALAENSGYQNFVMSASGTDAQQSLADWDGFRGDRRIVKVQTVTLDDVVNGLRQHGRAPAFVKCDVEGAEAKVLAGARRLFKSDSPPVFMIEINRKALAAQGSEVADVLDRFREYRLYFTPLDGEEKRMQHLTSFAALPELANVFAFPRRGEFSSRITTATEYLSDGAHLNHSVE